VSTPLSLCPLLARLFLRFPLRDAHADDPLQLADLANLTQPWNVEPSLLPRDVDPSKFSLMRTFKGLPPDRVAASRDELEAHFGALTGRPVPHADLVFARSWMFFRVRALGSVAMGIAGVAHISVFFLQSWR
jgi:hypothetical protein